MIENKVNAQKAFFNTHQTKKENFRKQSLLNIKKWMKDNEPLIKQALQLDLNKSSCESYMCEIGLTYSEINNQLKYLKKRMKPKRVKTPLSQFHAKSFEVKEPYGVVLVMSPWNYPFMLSMVPVIGAIAAGNCVILKPSAYAPHTAALLKKLIEETCIEEHVSVVMGGREENQQLLDQKFDYIFFTGSVNVGKVVMEKASKHLTPITLELGGKSPCIVDQDVNLNLAAKRIAFGKYLNSGQTCVAVDYLLVHHSQKDKLVEELKKQIHAFFGPQPLNHPQLVSIINNHHYERLIHLLDNQTILHGGKYQNQKIEPTIVEVNDINNPLMKEEIFGPILPILCYDDIQEALDVIQQFGKPLAFYLFTNSKQMEEKCLEEISFGGGCINDTIIHLANEQLGFGGVGESGMGAYHGQKSFDTFTHTKSIIKKYNWIDLPMRYYPYTEKKEKIIRKFIK